MAGVLNAISGERETSRRRDCALGTQLSIILRVN